MGRDIVLAKIKKGGITAIVGGAVLMLIFGLITIGVMSDNADDGMGMIILFGLFALLGIVFIIMGIRNIVRPEKNVYLKNNPQLLETADTDDLALGCISDLSAYYIDELYSNRK